MIKAEDARRRQRVSIQLDAQYIEQSRRISKLIREATDRGEGALTIGAREYKDTVLAELVDCGYKLVYRQDPKERKAVIDVVWNRPVTRWSWPPRGRWAK